MNAYAVIPYKEAQNQEKTDHPNQMLYCGHGLYKTPQTPKCFDGTTEFADFYSVYETEQSQLKPAAFSKGIHILLSTNTPKIFPEYQYAVHKISLLKSIISTT